MDGRVQKRSVQIDGIEVAPTSLAQQDHLALPEVADNAPNGALGEPQVPRDLVDRRVGTGREVEENAALRRKQRPAELVLPVRMTRRPALPCAFSLPVFPLGLVG